MFSQRTFRLITRSFAQEAKQATKVVNDNPNTIQEATVPLQMAVRVARSLAVGHPKRALSLNLLCKSSDVSVRDLRGAVVLPHRFTETKVCVISTDPGKLKIAKECGASTVGGEELIPLIKEDKLPLDRLIITPEVLPLLTPLARILGPRGIMPTVKKGTVTDDIKTAFDQQADAVLFKCDHNGLISCIVGKNSMKEDQLVENIRKFVEDVKSLKKGKQKKFVANLWLQMEDGPMIYADKTEYKI